MKHLKQRFSRHCTSGNNGDPMNQETSSVRPTISPVYYLKRIPGCGTRQGDSGIAWQTL